MFWRSRSFDVAVVGGGPAGSICAFLLARGGARVSLAHRAGNPDGGIELVSGRARRLIEQHCPEFFQQAVPGVEVHETISLWGTPTPVTWSAMCNPWGPGVAVERAVFDEALRDVARNAGVSIISGGDILGVERRDGRWRLPLLRRETVGSTMCADFLIIATGRAGTRFPGRAAVAESSYVALMTRLRTPGCEQGHAFYLEAVDKGWWYALPETDGGHFAGFCARSDEVKRRRVPLRRFFVRELQRTRLLAPLLSNAVVSQPIVGRSADVRVFDKVAGRGWIAIGDAAYTPDPLSGMGIEFCIESAARGARTLQMGGGRRDLGEYESWTASHARQQAEAQKFYHQVFAATP
jgi:flavin-dependent dehydrogenase